eukprot:11386871-Prorocentrum_lima.AAC.1
MGFNRHPNHQMIFPPHCPIPKENRASQLYPPRGQVSAVNYSWHEKLGSNTGFPGPPETL